MRLGNEAMERNCHVAEEDWIELVETKTQSSGAS